MASPTSDHSAALSKDFADTDADPDDFAKVWAALSKGEKTAEALESNLTSLEKKIDDLLASFEESERAKVGEANSREKGKEVNPNPISKIGEADTTQSNGESSDAGIS